MVKSASKVLHVSLGIGNWDNRLRRALKKYSGSRIILHLEGGGPAFRSVVEERLARSYKGNRITATLNPIKQRRGVKW